MPASDMMLVWMSAMPRRRSSHMIRNDASAASGSVKAMTNDVRKCSRMSRTQTVAVSMASTSGAGDGADGPADERRAVVEGHDARRRRAGRLAVARILSLMRRVTSRAFSPWRMRTTPPVTSLPSFSRTPRRGCGASVIVATSARRTVPPPRTRQQDVFEIAHDSFGIGVGVALARIGRASRRRGRCTRRWPCGSRRRRPPRWNAPPLATHRPAPRRAPAAVAGLPRRRTRRRNRRRWRPPPRLAPKLSCGRTYQSCTARSRARSWPWPFDRVPEDLTRGGRVRRRARERRQAAGHLGIGAAVAPPARGRRQNQRRPRR